MGRPLKIAKTTTVDIGIPSQTETGNIGIVGGDVATINTLEVTANIEYAPSQYASGSSYIVRQKGTYKYLVANVANPEQQGICYVTNSLTPVSAGQMTIVGTDAASGNIILAVVTNEYCVAFADQGNITNSPVTSVNLELGDAYYPSFVAANAAPQPGSLTPPGQYPILLLPTV
jgi:hypothetical protein